MANMTFKEAFASWEEVVKPTVIDQYGEGDIIALSESWNDYTDILCKDGSLTDLQYHYCPSWDDPMPDDDREFILKEMGVRISSERIPHRTDSLYQEWGDSASHWAVEIRRGANKFSINYSMGPAHKGNPDPLDVVFSLLSDIRGVEDRELEDWAVDLGFDPNSRKAERIFKACKKTLEDLQRLFSESEIEGLQELF